MTPTPCSSADLLADRRAHYADMLAASGDMGAAVDLMADALTLAPGRVVSFGGVGGIFAA